jgi:hypothetical protein
MQKGVATNPMVVGSTKNMVVRGLKSVYVNVRLSVVHLSWGPSRNIAIYLDHPN